MEPEFVKEMAEFLVKSNSIRFGLFKLSSGKESPYYIDLRILPSFPTYFRMVIGAFKNIIRQNNLAIDYICAVPTAGLVYASALSYDLEKALVYVRKEAKEYGTSKRLEGYLKPGSNVLVIDDVATTGRSIADAVVAIRNNGGVVENALVLIDRLEGASSTLHEIGVRLLSITNIKKISKLLYDSGMIEEEVFKTIGRQISH